MRNNQPYCALPVNTFRQKLKSNERVIGCWSSLGSPITTEILGLAGFDWLVLDAEHALNDVLSLVPQLMALKDSPSAPVVRPPCNDTVLIKRLLDAGFYNFLVPLINNAQEAETAVKAMRYPPHGVRGVSVAHRSNRFGTVPDYFKVINDCVSVIVQIETCAALENLDEICAVDGVDALFIGPSDLAACLGHLNDVHNREVQAAIKGITATAAKHGKAVGILAPVEDDARRYMDMGINLVAVGSDQGVFRTGTQALRDKFLL